MLYQLDFTAGLAEEINRSIKRNQLINAIRIISQDIKSGFYPNDLPYAGVTRAGRRAFIVNGIVLFYEIEEFGARCVIVGYML